MSGCRALTDEEIVLVRRSFGGEFARRDEALFMLGVKAGFRISELIAIRVKDVVQYGKIADRVEVSRQHMKGKQHSRSVPIHADARESLARWLPILQARLEGVLPGETPVFCSRVKDTQTGLPREQGWRILKEAFDTNELSGKLATHSLRKTFAVHVHAAYDGDLRKTQRALGHHNINSTLHYLALDEAEVDAGILAA
jgi:site-specific recombinase XerD